ncbi:MAG: glycosyltransferase family 2 protein [Candidatus Aenigmarchaeota archaeon]|nr:glycosyltransferase family 2 protein [Candidatus Aenigmarchaeota archaeon]
MAPLISVVVPAYNCRGTIDRCIQALKNLDFKNYEIIIVDDGSTDGTQDMLKKAASGKMRCMRQENAGPAAARNTGAKAARGEILAFTDSDCVPYPGWLDHVARQFADKGVVGVEGAIETDRMAVLTQSVKSEGGRFLTANMFYRKKDFLAEGGFDERFRRAFREDTDMAIRMMSLGRIVYEPTSKVYHIPRDVTLFSLIKRQELYFYEPLFFKKHGSRASRYSMHGIIGSPVVRSAIAGGAAVSLALGAIESAFFAIPAALWAASTIYFFVIIVKENKWNGPNVAALPFSFLLPLATLYWLVRGIIFWRG